MKITKTNTAFTAAFMVFATLSAKVCGMLRDILIAAMYGTQTAEAIAFSSASRIPVLFFDIAFGSAVTSAFIPVFNEYLSGKDKNSALDLANRFINLVLILTAFIAVLGIVFSRQLVNLIAGGYDADILSLISSLVVILFPMIVFTGLAFCVVGILQSFDRFIIPSVISLVSNAFLILYLVIFKNKFGVTGVATAMLISWTLQLIIQIPSLRKCGYRFRFTFSFKDEGIKKICLLALPIILSSWVQPINNLINIRLASSLAQKGSVAALDYANRLYIIFVSVFAYAITNLILPSLSRANADGDKKKFANIAGSGIRYALIVIVPVMAGFLLLSKPIIQLVYERGQFDAESTMLTSSALFYYSIGMVGYALQEISNRVFYAAQDGKTPMYISGVGVSINILLSIAFIKIFNLDHRALAFSAAISANIMGFAAFFIASSRNQGIITKDFIICVVKILISTAVMAIAVNGIGVLLKETALILRISACCTGGAVVYFVCAVILGVGEIKEIFSKVISIKKKNI